MMTTEPTAPVTPLAPEPESKAITTAKPMTPGFGTPVNPRLKVLRRTANNFSPSHPSPIEQNNNNSPNPITTPTTTCLNEQSIDESNQKLVISTPNWMKPNEEQTGQFNFKSNINFDNVIENFRTPEAAAALRKKHPAGPAGNNTPLNELFTNAITIAHANSQKPGFYSNYATSPAFEYSFDKSYNEAKAKRIEEATNRMSINDDDRIAPTPGEDKRLRALAGCIIYVSRKLVKQQTELGQIAQYLGAEFLWTYDESCTHFIYAGKLSDTNKELKVNGIFYKFD